MIAFSGDVTEERKVIREVIHEWNDVSTHASLVVLSLLDWKLIRHQS